MNPHAQNKTEYLRSLGYTGKDEIFVLDGKIICDNPRNMLNKKEWFFACNMLRDLNKIG